MERQYVESLEKAKMGRTESKLLGQWLKESEKGLLAAFNEQRDAKQQMTDDEMQDLEYSRALAQAKVYDRFYLEHGVNQIVAKQFSESNYLITQ